MATKKNKSKGTPKAKKIFYPDSSEPVVGEVVKRSRKDKKK